MTVWSSHFLPAAAVLLSKILAQGYEAKNCNLVIPVKMSMCRLHLCKIVYVLGVEMLMLM